MKIKPRSLFLIFILLLMIFTGVMSLSFGHYEAMLAPLLLSICIFVLGVIELVRELKSKGAEAPAVENEDVSLTVVATTKAGGETRRFGVALGWIGGFALGIYVLGFFLTTLLFAFSYLKVRGRTWLSSTAFAVIFTAVVYVIFSVGFKAQLYRGLVFG